MFYSLKPRPCSDFRDVSNFSAVQHNKYSNVFSLISDSYNATLQLHLVSLVD